MKKLTSVASVNVHIVEDLGKLRYHLIKRGVISRITTLEVETK